MQTVAKLVLVATLAFGCTQSGGGGETMMAALAECGADRVYVLGSSFSFDAQPADLDSFPAWQIYCGMSLDFIFNNPMGHCVNPSTLWPDVLEPPATEFDYISFQPVPVSGSTQQQDIDAITHWLAEQPLCTRVVIQQTWPVQARWEADLHEANPDHTLTNRSLDYGYDLRRKLEPMHPGRRFILTRSNEMIDFIFHDPSAPLTFLDLFRDSSGHASDGPGQYLQHNAMRQAMGQLVGIDVTSPGLDPVVKAYLDDVVESHATP